MTTDSCGRVSTQIQEARERSWQLLAGLSSQQLSPGYGKEVNPFLWELGHVAWFYEFFLLRQGEGLRPLDPGFDALYNSSQVAHDTRWSLQLPSLPETIGYLDRMVEAAGRLLTRPLVSKNTIYLARLSLYHHDMHNEAFTYMRQTLGYPQPLPGQNLGAADGLAQGSTDTSERGGDCELRGGEWLLGALAGAEEFVFDNEKWAHPVQVAPFRIARHAVTNGEYLAFVADDGYGRSRFWSPAGRRWLQEKGMEHPRYWRREANGDWLVRFFDRWQPLDPEQPVIHVCWHEAEAFCRWAGRRLPHEAEWEMAALQAGDGAAPTDKRRFPWGDTAPRPGHCNLDWRASGTVPVDRLPAGDSAAGCRQLVGNVWEWTAGDFGPFPGFVPDPYKDYSQPWFGTHKVLRGGSWGTRSRLIRGTWRNFFEPHRSDVFAGFRTCAA